METYSYKKNQLFVHVRKGVKERTHGWVLRAPRAGLGRVALLLILGRTQGDTGVEDAGAGLRHRLLLGGTLGDPISRA